MKSLGNRLLVGAFTSGAFIILLGFTVFTGGFLLLEMRMGDLFWFFMKICTDCMKGGKVTLNGVRIGRVERFFLGDAIEDAPVPVLVEINRKLVKGIW